MQQPQFQVLPVSNIELDKSNPRIQQFLEFYSEITSEMLALALSDNSNGDVTTSYRALKESIKVSGSIIHPIVVSHEPDGTYVVIEGNTRVQIYKEFARDGVQGNWSTIPALVYEQLTNEKKHEIRLQSHLVGPREWDPYSKAKYLYSLSVDQTMNMNAIVSMCGGREKDIIKSIEAYQEMRRYYEPYAKANGYIFDTRDFSKFLEGQAARVKHALQQKGYEANQFAKWVAEGKIDKAQLVRIIPAVMKNDEAHKAFVQGNLTAAEKVLHAAELSAADLSEYPYEVLANELFKKMTMLSHTEVVNLANDNDFSEKREALERLYGKLQFIIKAIKQQED